MPIRPSVRPTHVTWWLTTFSMVVALSMLAFGGFVLFEAREDAWHQALQASDNLAIAMERDIASNMTLFDLSLQGVLDALQQPALDQASPEIRHLALFGRAASTQYLGSLLLLDEDGNIAAASTALVPPRINLADRDYFRVHQDRADVGLFLSRPFFSRLRDGDASIAISRRVPTPDGHFRGVVVGAMRLAFFQEMFARLNLGPQAAVALLRADGRIIMRRPFRAGDIDRDLAKSPAILGFSQVAFGHLVSTATLDGVRRLHSFRHIGTLPLILTVSVGLDDIYAAWWRKAIGMGGVLTVLCGAIIALCLLVRAELLRRMTAEGALVEAMGRLAIVADTDGLTGLANRRAFDTALTREWKRAIRSKTPIALLMLDADFFKFFNDRYGHQEGDAVLQGIARCIQDNVFRATDTPARYGGEEFVILLAGTDYAGAVAVAERIRGAVEGLAIVHADCPNGHVTVSIGVAALRPVIGDAQTSIVRLADEALYDAKRTGRNRVNTSRREDAKVANWTPLVLSQR